MQVIENSQVKEKLYIEKLENGLTIMIIPKEGIRKKYVMFATHYGSIDNRFVIPGEEKETKVPDGIAHYLEHKMFEQQNGKNSLDVLTALGVNANAYTTTNYTTYLFEATDNFYEALDELMDYVQNPYFTDENVEKERGIISQEINMYDDEPEWVVYMNALRCMYKQHPITIDIAGTVESIKQIDKEVLYKCYNTFYNPSNMVMCFCGDFEPNSIIEEVEKRLVEKPKQGEIKRIFEKEQEEITCKKIEKEMEVSQPIFVIGIKDKLEKENIVKKHIAIEIILNMLIGKSSKLYKELYEQQLLFSEPYLEYEIGENYAHVAISGTSKNPEEVLNKLQGEIKKLKTNGINDSDLERIKNMLYGSAVKEFNSVSSISRMFITDYFKGINSFEYLEKYNQISKEYVAKVLDEVFNEEKTVISIVKQKSNIGGRKLETMNIVQFPGLNLNMQISKTAFTIGNIEIYWYALLMVFAFLISLIIYRIKDGKYDIKFDTILDLAVLVIPISIISARLYYVIFKLDYYLQNPIQILNFRNGGLAIYGGIIGGVLCCYFYCKRKKIDFINLLDYIVVCLPMRSINR